MRTKISNRELNIQIRVTKEEKEIFQKKAQKEGLSVSDYIRHEILVERRK